MLGSVGGSLASPYSQILISVHWKCTLIQSYSGSNLGRFELSLIEKRATVFDSDSWRNGYRFIFCLIFISTVVLDDFESAPKSNTITFNLYSTTPSFNLFSRNKLPLSICKLNGVDLSVILNLNSPYEYKSGSIASNCPILPPSGKSLSIVNS